MKVRWWPGNLAGHRQYVREKEIYSTNLREHLISREEVKTLKLKLISNSCLQPNMVCSDEHTSESFGYHSVLGPFNSHTLQVPTLQVRTNETWCVLSATQCVIVCGEWGNSISWSTPEQSDLWKLMFQVRLQLLARQGNSPLYITANNNSLGNCCHWFVVQCHNYWNRVHITSW